MINNQALILLILACAVGMFMWGRWRHDMVALGALLACVLTGLVPADQAFAGFGHPAVVTVACVLVLSRALQDSGVMEVIVHRYLPVSLGATSTIAALTLATAIPSAFMNNVGALALVMPMAIQIAPKKGLSVGRILMPVSFGSLLGGMITLIGTPPNLIVSSFRASETGNGFSMFDFTPVGLTVSAAGIIFLSILGWRLVPTRRRLGAEEFATGGYLTEVSVPEHSTAEGLTVREVEARLDSAGAQITAFIRNDIRVTAPRPTRKVMAGDLLVIEADPKSLTAALSILGLKLAEARGDAGQPANAARDDSRESTLAELAVMPDSPLIWRSASDVRMRSSFGINMLALSRQGTHSTARLRSMPIEPGDVLLMQGYPDAITEFASRFRCVPLAERKLTIPDRRQAGMALAIMAVTVLLAATGMTPPAIAFAGAVLASMALRTIPLRRVYDAVDWPLVVLLAALIPVAGAMGSTGAADLIARYLLGGLAPGHPVWALCLLMILTMLLTDFMNNAATAAVMCPIALGTAQSFGVHADPFLMAVAVGSSCAFLTPIGHQNNLLIMGPAGFRFSDYWRAGLPLDIIVVAVAVPVILKVWPM
ncbi:MAG TPA: SLC13 family permease [Aestuariivirga sp.]|mgnify:CR=1 FL=1|nr:anion permease [Alphaproteobacteria bacterium]HRX36177.1 SLC13 family permease [Aestuariivirga sp.]